MKEFDKNSMPFVFGLKKEGNFKVPKGYFEALPDLLLLIPEEQKKAKRRTFKAWVTYSSAIAALVIFSFLSGHFFEQEHTETELQLFNKSFAKLTAESFENEFIQEELLLYFNFSDEEELTFIAKSLDESLVKIELTNEDFIDFFETNIEYYY